LTDEDIAIEIEVDENLVQSIRQELETANDDMPNESNN
jgi:hypothetical protein